MTVAMRRPTRSAVGTPTASTQPVHVSDWRRDAVCAGEDPELFFPVGNNAAAYRQAEEAKAVCRRCPVMDRCLEWAAAHPIEARSGVWGGLSEPEMQAYRRIRSRQSGHAMRAEARDLAEEHGPDITAWFHAGSSSRHIAGRLRVEEDVVVATIRHLGLIPQSPAQQRWGPSTVLALANMPMVRLRLAAGVTAYIVGQELGVGAGAVERAVAIADEQVVDAQALDAAVAA